MGSRERIPERMTEATKHRWAEHHRRKGQQYIAAMPMGWIGATFKLAPFITKVALAVWFQVKRSRSGHAPISPKLLEQFGVSRKAGYIALNELEAAGLIEVARHRGRAPQVTIKVLENHRDNYPTTQNPSTART